MLKHIDGKLKSVPHGLLAKEILGLTLELTVLQSRAGWYIGTFDNEGPVSRESVEYFQTESLAVQALEQNLWNQKENP